MQYSITKKNVKQSIKNLSTFFKEKGFNIPQNIFIEGFSKALFFKNWNTLEGMTTNGNVITHLKNKKTYLLEIDINLDKDYVHKELLSSFAEANCEVEVTNFIHNGNSFHFEFSFPKSNNNFLTGMVLFAKRMQPHSPTRFEMVRMTIEKENLIGFLNI